MHIKRISGNIGQNSYNGIGGIDNLKGRIKSMKKYIILLIAMLICSFTLFTLVKIYPDWKKDKMVKEYEKDKEERIKNFKANKEIYDTLVNNLYEREEEIHIYFSDGNLKFTANEKEETIGKDEYTLYNKIYTLVKCKRIDLYKNEDGSKSIIIFLENEAWSAESIIYNEDREDSLNDSYDEIYPGWYYETSWYT